MAVLVPKDTVEWQGPHALTLNIYLGLVETYRIYTTLKFFQCYINHFPMIIPDQQPITICCNNQGILDQLQPQSNSYPHKALYDNYPVIWEIQEWILNLAK